ncbi:DEKNAAC100424 [Brettanomyces naardenensis]|uniref:cyclic pyranopterin monophosphate synthase n=1 Tax=Brettanomyces naardenensis TaxID=13370 RepID=A0A448YGI6_BRENA|nr:DEKNAAC100424 [Brettanomyces naardenensis]
MPEEGVELSPEKDLLNTDEIIRIAKLFALSGVRKIRLTGGEPTVRKDVIDIVRRLHEIPGVEEICMTSNGLALHRKLPALFENGLTSLNLSMDTMINGKFQIITRRNGLSAVIKSLHKAIELGIKNVKINTVVMRNFNDDEVMNFVELSRAKNIEVRFIEYMPFDGNKWSTKKMVPYQDILAKIRERYPGIYKLDAKPGDTAKKYHIPGFSGKIGFITSMTSDFCSSCTRLRITSDGNLKVCLFGNDELSLRDLMRSGASDEQILQKIGTAVKLKKEKHAGLDELKDLPNRPMILIDHNAFSSFNSRRFYSTKPKLTHLTGSGEAYMVDVHDKLITHRTAVTRGSIKFSNETALQLIKTNSNKKGDVIAISRVAGIMAAKKTSELIPLCHPLSITKLVISLSIDEHGNKIDAECTVECDGKTGVEMEALTGLQVSLLTVYDMCKAVDKKMIIDNCRLAKKTGGKSGDWILDD